jgi:NTE family protein
MSFAIAMSGGGERVVAWEVGVLAGLADGGVDSRRADVVLGTSAGALVAARVAAGIDPCADAACVRASRHVAGGAQAFAALAAEWERAGTTTAERRRAFGRLALERSPGGEEAAVANVAARLSGSVWPAALRVAAIDAQSGERVVFDGGSGVSLARAVAASRAVPVLRSPVDIGGRPFIDGALGSATNADALAGIAASLTIVVTPVPVDVVERGPERLWLTALYDEVAALERAGHDVAVVHASPDDRAAMGPDPMSGATAHLAVVAGRERGRAVAAQIRPRRAA